MMGLEVNSIDSLSSFGLFDGTHKMWRREISSALLATPYVLYEDPCKVLTPQLDDPTLFFLLV